MLTWDDIDLKGGTVRVTKTTTYDADGKLTVGPVKTEDGRRSVRIGQHLINVLTAHQSLVPQWLEGNLVFPNETGGLMRNNVVNRALTRALERAGLLRHTCATRHLADGDSLRAVQDPLGHSDSRITQQLYAHVSSIMHESVADHMDRL